MAKRCCQIVNSSAFLYHNFYHNSSLNPFQYIAIDFKTPVKSGLRIASIRTHSKDSTNSSPVSRTKTNGIRKSAVFLVFSGFCSKFKVTQTRFKPGRN